MIIKSLKLENIRSYTKEKIAFPTGSVLLSGDVGSGKSTILLAMDFALFGTRRGELDSTALLRHGCKEGSVEMEFEESGKKIKIKRVLKRKKTIMQDSGVLTIDGIKKELSPNELKAKIFDILGYPQDILKQNKPIFRFTVYTPQEQMKHILLFPKDRIEILRKIFGIDRYGTIRANSKMMMTEIRSMKREIESYIRDLDEKITKKQETESEKIKVTGQLGEEQKRFMEKEEAVKTKKQELDMIKQDIDELRKIKHELTAKESELQSKQSAGEDAKNEISKFDAKKNEYENELGQLGNIDFSVDELKNDIKILEDQKVGGIRERAILQEEIKKLKKILDEGICSFCGQDVHDKEKFVKNIDEKSIVEEKLQHNLGDNEEKIKKIREKISLLEKREHIKKNLKDVMGWKNDKLSYHDETVKCIITLNQNITSLKPRLDMFEEKEAQVKAIENEFQAAQREKFDVEKIITRLEQQIKGMDDTILMLSKEIENKTKSKGKIARLDELVKWFGEYFSPLMETIEKHVMYNIQQEFNNFFQEWLDILMAGEVSVKINEQFAPLIEQNGFTTEYENLSGGEKTSIALAYRLALNKVINIMIESIKTKDLLILDEPTDGFSMDQLDRMRDVLDKLNLGQVIIVSHEPKIDTFVNNVMRVYKDGHVSKISTSAER